MTATHDQLCAIPERLTTLEAAVAKHDQWITELLKQTAQLRQQQIDVATRPETIPRQAYNITETAQLLGITRQHVYTLIGAGLLQVTNLGRSRRIPAWQVDRLLNHERTPI